MFETLTRCIVTVSFYFKGTILLIEQQAKQFNALDGWFASSLGHSVASEFKKQLYPFQKYLKGDNLLQLGHCAQNVWLDDLVFKNKWIATPASCNKPNELICSLDQLPIQRNSLDCIVVPLALEPFNPDEYLINELDRVLKPMGYIIFLCINPWSLWGSALASGLLNCYADHSFKMHTSFHLNRLLFQRGYRQCALSTFYYIPPVRNKILINRLAFFNEIGKMLWPFPAGFYCYIAQKYEPLSPSLYSKTKRLDFINPLPAIN